MNVFDAHSRIVTDYSAYIRSFLNIADSAINATVEGELNRGKLWPEPLLQFNPAFEIVGKVKDVADAGLLHPAIADVFKGYSLYHHQVEALRLGTAGKDFVVTSGTGSGKSVTYIGTIFDHLLSHPTADGVTAVVVYPMNALINSQTEEFNRYRENYENTTGKAFPITFGQYTGQEKEESRQKMRERPPQVLLTNYMMLELLLTRLRERPIRDAIYANLRFLVFDELHTYRGRQGADVAMLIRRISARCAQKIVCIGTSATMTSTGSAESQRQQVAEVATTLFGRHFAPTQVVPEKLTRSLAFNEQMPTGPELAAAISEGVNLDGALDALRSNPVAIWLENQVALEERDGELARRKPQRIGEIVEALAHDAGLEFDLCRSFLADMLQWISLVNKRLQDGGQRYTVLPFKLHQFISQTGSVYTTLDQDENRFITLEPGVFKQDEAEKKPIFPNLFSRASGHAFLCVSRKGDRLEPREFRSSGDDDSDEAEATDGYLIIGDEVWNPDEDMDYLPESWLRVTKTGLAPTAERRPYFPVKLYFDESGRCSETEPLKWWGWFMKAPLLFDPTGGVFFDTKTSEGAKLTKLGSEGRSTSTTITAFSVINQLSEAGYHPKDQKLLSFTDNRQDAALQAGHFNDFIQVVQLRAAIHKALQAAPDNRLTFANIGQAIFKALDLPFQEFANRKEEGTFGPLRRRYEQTFQDFLFYRAIADLRRSWRIVLPNLEQCALLTIEYADIDEIAAADEIWHDLPVLDRMSPGERREFITNILDFFRLEYAIYSENYLTQARIKENEKIFREMLRSPWSLDPREELRDPYVVRLDPLSKRARLASVSMGPTSALGKYLKQFVRQYDRQVDLKKDGYRNFVLTLMAKLEGSDYLVSTTARTEQNAEIPVYRLRLDRIVWQLGDGKTVKADLIKRRAYKSQTLQPNRFFQAIYQRDFSRIKRLQAGDHTGQLGTDDRRDREDRFRADWYLDEAKHVLDEQRIRSESLSALFCSPTMELGIDIGGLSVVHMRNAPPNPSNYVQRSGRAGRSGQGALIFTYCSSYSPHDRHYFRHGSFSTDSALQIFGAPTVGLQE